MLSASSDKRVKKNVFYISTDVELNEMNDTLVSR